MENRHTAEVEFILAGKKLRLIYDWMAISDIEAKFGKENVTKFFKQAKPEFVADMLLIGLRRHHPQVTREEIVLASPPIMPALKIIDRALNLALFGPTEQLPASAEKPETSEKKTKRRKD